MTFRDDNDAMLARTEALERENQRLAEENEALERKAAEAEQKRAEAERIAAAASAGDREKRERLEALAAKASNVAPDAPLSPADEAERKKQHALRSAFMPWWADLKFLLVTAILLVVVFVYERAFFASSIGSSGFVVVVSLAFGVWAYAVYRHVTGRFTDELRARLQQLPFPIDVAQYLDRMGTRFDSTLDVFVDMPTATTQTDRELIEKAVLGGMKGARATWDRDTLHITSPALQVAYLAKAPGGGSYTYSQNGKPHRWFTKLVQRVLRPIHATHSIAAVRFTPSVKP